MEDWTAAIVSTVPLGIPLTLIFQAHGIPGWLYALGAVSVVLGAATFVDTLNLGGLKREKQAKRHPKGHPGGHHG